MCCSSFSSNNERFRRLPIIGPMAIAGLATKA
jgi:hypothetical protein